MMVRASNGSVYAIDFREVAPAASTTDMFHSDEALSTTVRREGETQGGDGEQWRRREGGGREGGGLRGGGRGEGGEEDAGAMCSFLLLRVGCLLPCRER